MTHIFISYRRTDSDAIAGRVKDRLANHFGDESVYMDVDSIPFGFDFRDHVQDELAQNDILIAIIGPNWRGQGKGGGVRIMDETDPVRIEIETALKRGSAVIPVLVGGATMPDTADLPEGLKNLAFRNAAEVDAGRDFHQHIERLIHSMDFILAKKGKAGKAAPANPTVDKPPPIEPVSVAPTPAPSVAPVVAVAPAVQPAPMASVATPVAAPARARTSRTGWIAAAAIVLLVAGTGSLALLYVNMNPKTPVAKVEEPPKATPVLQGGGLTTVATGCKLDHPTTLADDFKNADPGWTLPAQIAYLADGQLALKAMEGQIGRALYQPFRFKNVAVCAQVKSPAQIGALDGTADAGVMFWATDTTNFYIASVYLNGTYSIERQASGTWATVAPRAPFAGIKQGPNVVNEIQVITKDTIGTLFINGAKVQEFRGQPPKDNSMIGLYGSSNKDERNEWRVLSVVAADPDRPQARTPQKMPTPQIALGCKPSRSVAFEDKFNSVDPGWGIAANTAASYVDGQLAIKPPADKVWRELYSSLFFKSATVCIRVKSPSQLAKLDGTANGGLAFWGINRSNYYTADVYPDGHIDVYRSINNEFVKVLPAVKSTAVKTGLGAINELMVAYSGDMASFHVNGQKVFEFRGQPPQNGGSIGLFAQSEKEKENDWRFLDIVVVENE